MRIYETPKRRWAELGLLYGPADVVDATPAALAQEQAPQDVSQDAGRRARGLRKGRNNFVKDWR